MSEGRLAPYAGLLAGLERKSRARRLEGRAGLDLASNDYLALAGAPRLAASVTAAIARGVPVGAAGSRLLRGNHPEHEALEAEAAAFFGAGAALYFGSGYAANVALFSALPQRGDLVLHDALIHASVHEGLALTKAEVAAFAHNDLDDLAARLAAFRAGNARGRPWIAVESVYSMDGDRADVPALMGLAEEFGAFLVVDEAHATGVFGPDGRGLSAAFEGHEALVALHTCGKALGASGALVTAHPTLIAMLVNRGRPFIYATAPSPLMAAAVRESLRILADEPERRTALAARVEAVSRALADRLGIAPSGSQILPVVLGANARATAAAARLRAAGFDARAVRPPTVPEGTARIRLSITLHLAAERVGALVDALAEAVSDLP